MLRRPPGHVAPQRKYLLALALILLPWLPLADAQQQHQRLRSPREDDQHAAANLAATPVTGQQETVETPLIHQRRKTTVASEVDVDVDDEIRQRILARSRHNNDNFIIPDDARAHALAPDLSVRAPPPSQHRGPSPGAGLSQHVARSLEDWEVEDFVLLATVDGDLYASDRKTGQERWHFKADHPLVETTHFRTNRSVLDDDYRPMDHYIWIVEPTRDGELYLWRPGENGAGLAKMALTMKKLVELTPHRDTENRVIYTADKKTTMITLNAATGTILKQFGSSGSYVNKVDSESCFKPNALADGDEECSEDSTITLGRTEYTVGIQRFDGSPIASLKYSEWGPNTQDNDLMQQNLMSKDNRYVTGQHDGKVYGFEYGRFQEQRPFFTKTLGSPVARVFDVLHRWGPAARLDPELIVLPQPPLPANDEDNMRLRSEKVFMNQTEEGSWYALSGSRYPLILSAPAAPIHRVDWWRIKEAWDLLPESQKSRALVGTHQLPDGLITDDGKTIRDGQRQPLSIDGPRPDPDGLPDHGAEPPGLPAPPRAEAGAILLKLPELVLTRVFDLVSNPAAIVLFLVTLWYLYKDKVVSSGRKSTGKGDAFASRIEVSPTVSRPATPPPALPAAVAPTETRAEVAAPEAVVVDAVPPETPAEPSSGSQTPPREHSPTVTFAEPPETTPPPTDGVDAAGAGETKKKKGHRGRRGGVKHRKGNKDKRENSQSRDDDPPQETVEEVINKAKTLVREPKLEPDIITVSGDADEVSGHILKMGSLEVNEAEQLGTGSNGTIVFAGKWDGRDVAVKRMLVQFNEIASQETRLLRESDDHPNGRSTSSPGVCPC